MLYKKKKYRQITSKEIKQDLIVYIYMGSRPEKHLVRKRLDEKTLRKLKVGWPKEETREDYKEYRRILDVYASNGQLYVLDEENNK